MWVSTGFTAGNVFVPRATRLAVTTLAALAGSDSSSSPTPRLEQRAGDGTTANSPNGTVTGAAAPAVLRPGPAGLPPRGDFLGLTGAGGRLCWPRSR